MIHIIIGTKAQLIKMALIMVELQNQKIDDQMRSCLSYNKANQHQHLNWKPEISLNQGLKETYKWFKGESEKGVRG